MAYEFGRRPRAGPTSPLRRWSVFEGELKKITERIGFIPVTSDFKALDRGDLISASHHHGGLRIALQKFADQHPEIEKKIFPRFATPILPERLGKIGPERYQLIKRLAILHAYNAEDIAWRIGVSKEEVQKYLEIVKEAEQVRASRLKKFGRTQ
ncbi:MAG TPA: hypothetical protein VGQ00_03425 [Candidatus Norongarragalinales archaeon]|nr:hypothetical protein [Candidatus Norongarragalinales archaeon]